MTIYSWFDSNKPVNPPLKNNNKISSKTKVNNQGMWPQASVVTPAVVKSLHAENQQRTEAVKSDVVSPLT